MGAPTHRTCQGCGATITAEQIARREAGLLRGVLLCPKCVAAKRREAAQQAAAQAAPAAGPTSPPPVVAERAAPASTPESSTIDEPLALVGEDDVTDRPSGTIRSLGGFGFNRAQRDERYKRPLLASSDPPTRCRTFHAKLTDASIGHLDEQINDWLDAHPDIYIKQVASAVGPFEGKHVEPHLILSVFY